MKTGKKKKKWGCIIIKGSRAPLSVAAVPVADDGGASWATASGAYRPRSARAAVFLEKIWVGLHFLQFPYSPPPLPTLFSSYTATASWHALSTASLTRSLITTAVRAWSPHPSASDDPRAFGIDSALINYICLVK